MPELLVSFFSDLLVLRTDELLVVVLEFFCVGAGSFDVTYLGLVSSRVGMIVVVGSEAPHPIGCL